MPESDTPSRPLTQHLDDLYALAYVLGGETYAERLLVDTYQQAAETPPEDRPDDPRSWLIRLLLDTHASLTQDKTDRNSPVRREAARQAAARTVPVAFAACSSRERLILTLDVALNFGATTIADTLDTDRETAHAERDAAWESLRATLRDLLSGPERMLVDTALTKETLRETLRAHLATDARPAPTSLRSEIASVLREAKDETTDDAPPSSSRTQSQSPASSRQRSPSSRTKARIPWKRILGGALSLLLLGAAAYVLTFAFSPSPEPDPSLTTFSARRVEAVSAPIQAGSPTEASRVLRNEWERRLTIPTIEHARITGIAHLTVASDLAIPALLYADSTAEGRITVFAYNYALLDRIGDRAQLDPDARERLSEEGRPITRREIDQSIVLWRQRDDIFLAVAPHLAPEELSSRIKF